MYSKLHHQFSAIYFQVFNFLENLILKFYVVCTSFLICFALFRNKLELNFQYNYENVKLIFINLYQLLQFSPSQSLNKKVNLNQAKIGSTLILLFNEFKFKFIFDFQLILSNLIFIYVEIIIHIWNWFLYCVSIFQYIFWIFKDIL